MKIAFGIFAKTPELSPVKTRLAQTIGEEQANAFYELSVAAVSQNLKGLKAIFNESVDLSFYWALAEEEGPENPYWREKVCFWTGEGSLGERLYQVSHRLFEDHDYVFVMGTDSPQVGSEALKKVVEKALKFEAEALEGREKAIIGPCSDGGFYLFGMAKPLAKEVWTSVTYSRDNTCQQLVDKLTEKGYDIENLSLYGDVDVVEDLGKLKKELLEVQGALNNEQKNLLNWLSYGLSK